jgi:hypothetical protein
LAWAEANIKKIDSVGTDGILLHMLIHFYDILHQMKTGQPTYKTAGANWDHNSVPNK